MTATSSGADLQQLMMIAELYARKLAADAGPPPRVLMLERAGELDFVTLDGRDRADRRGVTAGRVAPSPPAARCRDPTRCRPGCRPAHPGHRLVRLVPHRRPTRTAGADSAR